MLQKKDEIFKEVLNVLTLKMTFKIQSVTEMAQTMMQC